jgi:hypothetical protein
VFHGFVQAKFAISGLILGSSQVLLLPQRRSKMTLAIIVIKKHYKNESQSQYVSPA